jgi:hypothetical protein
LKVEINSLRTKIKTIEGELKQYESEDGQIPENSPTDIKTTVQAANKPDLPEESSDVINQIKQLGELKEKGILTEEEFEKKKTELLARL